ncbi:MAG: AMP-binding protein, partial [Actinomycetota bacterium]|nr:AMP-binding protein [Actinomycetota bacterium]
MPGPSQNPPASQSVTRPEIERHLTEQVAHRLGRPCEEIDPRSPLAAFGLKSVDMLGIVGELEQFVGRSLSATLAWEHPTIEALAEHLACETVPHQADSDRTQPATSGRADPTGGEPIAVVGIGCRFPGGADDVRSFWDMLCRGQDAITEVPPDRWDAEEFYDEDPRAPGKATTRWGGFLRDIDRFDPRFFGISPREAERMDPQQRLLAEVAWEAFEDAGLGADTLAGSSTGVFVGIATNDYAMLQSGDHDHIDMHFGTGNASSIAANRLSYLFDLRGPSLALDTACSSSLVSVHEACASLARGDCSLALAGGVNLILSPALAINFSKAGAMAADGRCKAFDARADGYVRSEGAGVVVLKPLSRALADRDRIHGVILAGAVNQDGRTNGLMAPNPQAQEAVVRAAQERAGVRSHDVGYVETHGTGTLLGDPIEAKSLAAVVGRDREPADPCLIGSVKSNIGHLEAAAGVAGLIKAILVVRERQIPASLHYSTPNPHIPFEELGLRVVDSTTPWPRQDRPAIAGVSAFGFGGTNAHLIVREPPRPEQSPTARTGQTDQTAPTTQTGPTRRAPHLLTVSARDAGALRELAGRYRRALAASPAQTAPEDVVAAAAVRRTHHDHRLACVGSDAQDLCAALEAFERQEERPGLSAGPRRVALRPRPVFVFSGQGPRWWPLGEDLLDEPVLLHRLERCDALLRDQVEWSLLDQLTLGERSRLEDADVAQPALCSLQIALAALWRSWGVEPAVVLGHSVGEIAAAHVAGALDLSQALRIAVHRGRVIARATSGDGEGGAAGAGGMSVVGLSLSATRSLLERSGQESVWVAASNAPDSTVLSGRVEALERIEKLLQDDDVLARRLGSVHFASHCPLMDPLAEQLRASLNGLRSRRVTTSILSTVTGRLHDGAALGADYWGENLRRPVLFDPAVTTLLESGHDTFVEISPHPMLADSLRERMDLLGATGVAVTSLRREEPVRATTLSRLGRLYTA